MSSSARDRITRREALRWGLGGAAILASDASLGLVPGLTDCDGTTGLQRVHFTLQVGGFAREGSGPLSFRNLAGWDVMLGVAQVAIGPIYFNVAPPLTQRIPKRRRSLAEVLVGSARADETADHLTGGRVIAQVTERVVVDALSPALQLLGSGDGVSEHARTAEIWLLPHAPTGAMLPGGAAALVRGTARKDGVAVPFLGRLLLDERMAPGQTLPQLRTARRIPADLDFTKHPDGAVLTLRVDPRPWLRGVDFAPLLMRPLEDGAHVAGPDDQLLRELLNGVRQSRDVYTLSLASAP